jgi:hypothetical protein
MSIHGARNFPLRKVSGSLDVGLDDGTGDEEYLAALAAAAKVSAVWYVAPKSFDHGRFTTGVGTTEAFEIRLRSPGVARETPG